MKLLLVNGENTLKIEKCILYLLYRETEKNKKKIEIKIKR